MKSAILFLVFFFFIFSSCGKENDEEDNSTINIFISSPTMNASVQDTIDIHCDIDNKNDVLKIELWIDGDSTGIIDYDAPFILQWDTHNYSNGSHTLFVRLYDHSGNIVDTDYVILNVNNFLVFQSTFGSEDINEVGYSVVQNSDSNLVILGSIDNDIMLIETDRYGTVQWNQSYGGSQLDQAYHLQQTSDGGYIISGSTESFGFGESDIRLTKTDPNGLIEWNTYLGSSHNEYGGQVLSTTDGGYILIGNRDFHGDGNSDIWLIKTNSQGDTLWTQTYGGVGYEYGADIILAEDGGYFLLGSTTSYGNGDSDIWLIKTDLNGNQEWDHSYGDGSNDYGESILQTYDGGLMIQFIIQSFGSGNTAVGLLRINTIGEKIWSKAFGGTYAKGGNTLQQLDLNNYIFACSVFNHGDNAYDAWMIKIDDNGEIIWDRTFGSGGDDKGLSVLQTLDNGFVIIGSTNNFGYGDSNSSDLWLIKTNPQGYTKDLSN